MDGRAGPVRQLTGRGSGIIEVEQQGKGTIASNQKGVETACIVLFPKDETTSITLQQRNISLVRKIAKIRIFCDTGGEVFRLLLNSVIGS